MKKPITSSISGKTKAEILKYRARLLAEKKSTETTPSDFIKVVAFYLSGETYGIELEYIRMVTPIKEMIPIPGAPPFISGIINMRGEIISIVDVKKLFDLPAGKSSDQRHGIILSAMGMELGIEVDRILGVMPVAVQEIHPGLPTLSGIRGKYLKGVTGRGMVILDGEKILTDKSMIVSFEDETS